MKKFLSIILSVVMALTCLTTATAAFADNGKSVNVEFSVYDGGVFTMLPQIINVREDADDKYADAIGYNDADGGVTVYDAIVTAHVALFGEDFMTYAPIEYSNAMLKQSFGENSTALTYHINGGIDDGTGNYYNLDTVLNEGDYVEYAFYQDASFYSDKYTRFDKRTASLQQGDSLTLTLSVETYDAANNWALTYLPAADMQITVDGADVGKTDANGQITLNFNKLGTFGVSATGQYGDDYDDYEIFAPYCTVTVSNQLCDYVTKEQKNAVNYVKSNKYTIDNAFDFITIVRSGADVSAYKDEFIKSVKDNLDTNGGKLISSTTNKENLGLYGAVISIVKALGYPSNNFFGYDIDAAFEAADITEARPHQYHYKYAVESASPTRAKAIINDLIANYYTLGQGMNNYGYSCDNTAHFLITIAPYANDFTEYVNDAKELIKAHTSEKGAYYSQQYNDPNADSTAVAMAAFASIGDVEQTFKYYKALVENYEAATPGIMLYYGEENAYATGDALFTFYYAKNAFIKESYEHPSDVVKKKAAVAATCTKTGLTEGKYCAVCDKVITEQKTVGKKQHTIVTDKAVAPTFKKAGKTAGKHCKYCNKVTVKQKTVKKLGSPKMKKVKAGKKSFTATWSKANGVAGYQVQYSVKKNFKKATTRKLKKNKLTVKKLKKNKTYYVRVRAYKKINGKMNYSKWSATKVKVK